jgi:hypothetical protein
MRAYLLCKINRGNYIEIAQAFTQQEMDENAEAWIDQIDATIEEVKESPRNVLAAVGFGVVAIDIDEKDLLAAVELGRARIQREEQDV